MPWRLRLDAGELPLPDTVTITFRFRVGQPVAWRGRPGRFVVIWRRWHEGQVGVHVLYGLCRATEERHPAAQIWTALDKDLEVP